MQALNMDVTTKLRNSGKNVSGKSEEKQLNLIDKLADSDSLLNKYQTLFADYNKLKSEINQIKNGKNLSDSELDYLVEKGQEFIEDEYMETKEDVIEKNPTKKEIAIKPQNKLED